MKLIKLMQLKGLPLLIILVFSGCDSADSIINPMEGIGHNGDVLPAGFVSNDDLGQSISVKEAREENTPGKTLVVEGFIGGRKKPFSQGFAVFILGDDSLETCDEVPGDNCPTPWDACCEDKRKILGGTLSVEILDENASLLKLAGSLQGIQGLQPGQKVKVLCKVSHDSIPEAMVVNASRIQLL